MKQVIAITIMTAGLALIGTSATAQQQPTQQQEYQPVADSTLKQVASIMSSINDISADYQEKLSQTEDPEKHQSLQNEARGKMADVIDDSGLSISEYNALIRRLQTDETLRQRLNNLEN